MSTISSANKREKLSSKGARIFNSAMAFVIAYMFIMFMFSVATALMGKMFGFDSQISYSGVRFEVGRHSWDKFNVFFVWSAGTLFTIVVGGLASYLFYTFKEKAFLGNLTFLWASVIAFSIVAAQGLLPCLQPGEYLSPFYNNLAVVFAWLYVPVPILYIFCVFFMAFLVFFSIYTSKPFLSFSYSFSKVNKTERKRKYFFETVFVPFLIGAMVLMSYTYLTYQSVNFIFLNGVYLFCIAVSLTVSFFVININDMKVDEVLRYKNLQKLNPILFLIFIVVLIFFAAANKGFYLPF